jgi:dUTP pyrophosphatase
MSTSAIILPPTTSGCVTPAEFLRVDDILRDLRSLAAGHPDGSGARSTLVAAILEIETLRRRCSEFQAGNTALVLKNRDLKAIVAGHPVVRWKRVGDPGLAPPRYETDGAAGMDLRADICGMHRLGHGVVRLPPSGDRPLSLTIYPGARALIPCGFAFEIPPGFEGQVRGRSSLTKRGVLAPTGTIDSDYRGVVSTYVWNLSSEAVEIEQGDRIAQFIIMVAPQARLEETTELSPTVRGEGGYGSTGVR